MYILVAAAVALLVPFWASMLLAVWFGVAGLHVMPRLTRFFGGRPSVAAVTLLVSVALVAAPIVGMLYTISMDAWQFVNTAMESPEWRETLQVLVSPSDVAATADSTAGPDVVAVPLLDGSGAELTEGSGTTEGSGAAADDDGLWGLGDPWAVLSQYSGRAWSAVMVLAGAAVRAILDILIFFVVFYAVLTDGPRAWRWFKDNAPLPSDHLDRYGKAFNETGYGLVVGFGGAALAQATVAVILFTIVGVSRVLVLGVLMLAGAIVPGVGTAFVWIPVAIGLYLSGRTQAAVAVALVGFFIIGSIDNLVRPVLTRYAALQLPMYVVFVSMFGGLMLLGPVGLLAGPLLVRLASEALEIHRQERAAKAGPPAAEGSPDSSGVPIEPV